MAYCYVSVHGREIHDLGLERDSTEQAISAKSRDRDLGRSLKCLCMFRFICGLKIRTSELHLSTFDMSCLIGAEGITYQSSVF